MPRNHAHRSPKKRKPAARSNTRKSGTNSPLRWPWLLSGFLLGMLTMGLLQSWDKPQQDIAQVIESIAGGEKSQPGKPRFDFPEILLNSEVIVPDIEKSPERGIQQAEPGIKQNNEQFLLQAGSFRNASDADGLRVRLLLLNMDVHIEEATSGAEGTWHRVIVGPFKSQSRLTSARETLLQNGIDNLVLRRREED